MKFFRKAYKELSPDDSNFFPGNNYVSTAFLSLGLVYVVHSFLLSWLKSSREGNTSSGFFMYIVIGLSGISLVLLGYSLVQWLRLKRKDPSIEGPFFKSHVSALRRWAFYLALALTPSVPESLRGGAMFTNPRLWAALALVNSFFSAIIVAELFRIIRHENPWSDRKHIIILCVSFIVIISLQIPFFVYSGAYITFKYNFY